MKVRLALGGEDCRHEYVTHFWLYYILFIIITITFSYILTIEIMAHISASALLLMWRDVGAVIILVHIGCQYHLTNCEI